MRESRAPAPRQPPALVPCVTPALDAFDLADKLITVDGVEMRLGDYWGQARIEASLSLRGSHE